MQLFACAVVRLAVAMHGCLGERAGSSHGRARWQHSQGVVVKAVHGFHAALLLTHFSRDPAHCSEQDGFWKCRQGGGWFLTAGSWFRRESQLGIPHLAPVCGGAMGSRTPADHASSEAHPREEALGADPDARAYLAGGPGADAAHPWFLVRSLPSSGAAATTRHSVTAVPLTAMASGTTSP